MESDNCKRLYDAILENRPGTCKEILEFHKTRISDLQVGRTLASSFLPVACTYRRSEIIQILLREGADVYCKDSFGRTPLQIITSLWPRAGPWDKPYEEFLDDAEKKFWSRMITKHDESLKCLLILLAYGADVNQRFSDGGSTALHNCAQKELFSAVDALLLFGADIERRDANLCTPLLHASKHGVHRSVRHLLVHGANFRSEDTDGSTVLHLLSGSERTSANDMTSLTLVFPQILWSINKPNFRGSFPLHKACYSGDGEKIKFLLNKNANPNERDRCGRSALFTLLDNNNIGQCLLGLLSLLEASAQPSVQDREGNLPKYLLSSNRVQFRTHLLRLSQSPVTLYELCQQTVILTLKHSRRSVLHVYQLSLPTNVKDSIVTVKQRRRDVWESLLAPHSHDDSER